MRKRKSFLIVLLIATGGLTSCNKHASSEPLRQEISSSGNNEKTEIQIEKLNEKDALALRNKAANHYFNVLDGGTDRTAQQKSTPLTEDYFYNFCDDLDTIDKLTAYLEEVFTKEITADFIKTSDFKMINNKLSYPSLGWGSLSDWEKAAVKLKADEGNVKTFEFTVPSVEESMNDETVSLEYKYVPQKGWRVASRPSKLM
ncbi:IseA DL-endopeptidase inhibitor family protein [Paenibacillus sp. MZ04-78.2]|uniref:IseA DL-endopeptidase inhibitor family protein n=1 Tax=Paenibacillus sp. MZ04-78.2 TaxID=2962034 RepID=UPI0020B8C6FE|nr:IseA DL-endopeptidase inhibitor family protein [Paenibacillus sp. MZ04-78.2]MCP3776601.1 IseA DL-endopeptidase inhibitor family protein [Paenibacillus sp. MZ04-78.2]